ncbi:killer toxin resistant protein [Malassezia nana]|uniref:Killer toxin resistant protein n=1 Tax=Malassezia nana TaxID=180528 RepID=A0AAF0J2M7_9BASI|nr:killer toxin resistant protein [Malassezia nana]
MIEAVESVWPQHFFSIVSRVWANDNVDHFTRATQKEVFELVESAIRHYLTEQQVPHYLEGLDEWHIHVAQHWSAARVEAHYQIFNTSREIQSLDPSCDTFVHLHGQILCSPEEAHTKLKLYAHGSPAALPHDHAYPVLHSSRSVVILYADPYSRSFASFHGQLMRLAEQLPLTYVLRWRPSVAAVEPRAYMPYISGFGTSLHLKKVDYLVLDDREVDVEQTTDDESQALDPLHELRAGILDQLSLPSSSRLRTSVQEAVQTQANLSTTEFLYLGQATAKLILESKDPLSTLIALASDFPVYATALSQFAATLSESDPIFAQLNDQSTMFVQPGYSQLWINGMAVSEEELDLQVFMERIQQERRLQSYFSAPELGISPDSVETILTSPSISKAFGMHKSSVLFYDVSDIREARRTSTGTHVIAWINDLEDGTYSGYPETIELMAEYRWSSFPLVARNLFQLVVHIDLGDPEVLLFMNKVLDRSLSAHAFRWGVVPLLVDEESETLAQVLWHATENMRPHEVSHLFKRLAQSPLNEKGRVDATRSRQILEQMISDGIKKEDDLLMSFIKENRTTPGSRLRLIRTRDYLERLYSVPRPDAYGMAYLNGQPVSLNDNLYFDLSHAVTYQLRLASHEIYSGRLDEDNLYESFYYTLRGTRGSRSMLVTMLEETRMSLRPNKFVNMPQVFQCLGEFEQPLRHFVYASDDSLVSIRLVGDLDSQAMITQMAAALDAMRPEVEPFRLSFLHTGPEDGFVARWILSVMHSGTLSSISPQELSAALKSTDREAALSRLSSEHETAPKELSWQPIASAFILASQMDLETGITMLMNGHILSDVTGFRTRDLEEALAWERAEHVDALLEAVDVPEGPPDVRSQVVEFGVSVVGTAFTDALDKGGALKASQDRLPVALAMEARAGLTFSHGHPSSSIHVTAVLDPLDSKTSHIASLLRMLASMAGVRFTVMMNPHLRVTSLPLQKFTRFDMRVTPEFDANGDEVAPVTVFQDVPATSVLTMQLHAPRTLVTMAEEALYDLDNLRLADVNGVMHAIYSVNSVLIEGHTRAEQEPTPRGLQLTLSTDDDSISLDTIVMETLGYFQFRSQPGRWKLSIRTGKSAELYEMETVGAWGWQSPSVHVTGPDVVLDQLSGLLIFPMVRKRNGKERESLVADVAETGQKDLVDHVKSKMRGFVSLLGGRKNPHADVNIFTIASGHLYERMTYIMILSVLRHTKSTVKFWFIENFLSPSFKAFIPHLANKYGFSYELITFAWPHWLREQTEKQRTIWAYKILFLDVLFPLDLDRVIFVDADQIVRTDLKVLNDMDLHGAPYGYPPMGDDSEDMDGYRFWKKGYWKTFLRGKTYHISALYVVDLNRFRYVGAGDILRRHYQQLTADKNSLANLDQDLPNHRKCL